MTNFISQRIIIIGGVSFSGSTVLSHVLGSLPNATNIGESHWLVDPMANGSYLGCGCEEGTNCAIISELRAKLQSDPSRWYPTIAEHLSVRTLIASDKDPDIIKRNDPDGGHDILFLYRDPARAWASQSKKGRNIEGVGVESYLNLWSRYSDYYIRDHGNKGKIFYLNFTKFASSPNKYLNAICAAMELEFDPGAVKYWEKRQHFMGGNFNLSDFYSYSRQKFRDNVSVDRLAIRPDQEPALSDEERAAVNNHTTSADMFSKLESLSIVLP